MSGRAEAGSFGNSVTESVMKKLRSLHLYLGCIFAPMLLLFAISGTWQTLGLGYRSHILTSLSTIHTGHGLKSGLTLSSPILRYFVLAMASGFMVTTFLGIIMAVKYGGNRRAACYCIAFGVLFPSAVILISVLSR